MNDEIKNELPVDPAQRRLLLQEMIRLKESHRDWNRDRVLQRALRTGKYKMTQNIKRSGGNMGGSGAQEGSSSSHSSQENSSSELYILVPK